MIRKHSKLFSLLVIFLFSMTVLAGCGAPAKEEPKKTEAPKEAPKAAYKYTPIKDRGYTNPDALIDTEGLKKIMKDPKVRIIDVRATTSYVLGHIPGAVAPDGFRDAYSTPTPKSDKEPLEGMIGTKEQVEKMFSAMGIEPDTHIVFYDDKGIYDAARLYWQTKMVFGHKGKLQILDGGLKKWKADGGETEMSSPKITPTKYVAGEPKTDKSFYATLDMVKAVVDKKDYKDYVILDTREKSESWGEEIKKGAFDKGRIPGAVIIVWSEDQNKDDSTMMNAADLKKLYEAKGVTADKKGIYPYCQSGVRSAHTWFTLTELLGYKNVSNYDGSWIEWSKLTKEGKLPKEEGEPKK